MRIGGEGANNNVRDPIEPRKCPSPHYPVMLVVKVA